MIESVAEGGPLAVDDLLSRLATGKDPIDRLSILNTLTAAAEAEKIRVRADLAARQYAADGADPRVAAERRGRVIVTEVALAERVSTRSATARLTYAEEVSVVHPMCLESLEYGDLAPGTLRGIVVATRPLDEDRRIIVDREIAAAICARDLTHQQILRIADRKVVEADASAATTRAAQARRRRGVSFHRLPDTVAALEVVVPAEDALEAIETLRADAVSAHDAGDDRSVRQLMADLAVERLTGRSVASQRSVELQVVIGASSLLGHGGAAALEGYGALPADVAAALADSPHLWLRRLVADPDHGHLVATDKRTRAFRGEIREFLRLRSRSCAIGGCGGPIEHAGHIRGYASGGTTEVVNGYGLCREHNAAQEHPGVRVERLDDAGTTAWTLPSGRTYLNRPPPLLGHGTGESPPF